MKIINVTLFTDDPEMANLCTAYWETDDTGKFVHKITELADIADVRPCKITQLAKKYSKAFLDEIVCKNCQQPYSIQTRSEYLSAKSDWVCDNCRQMQFEKEELQQKRDLNEMRKLIKSEYCNNSPTVMPLENLSLSQAVYMLSLMRFALSEDMNFLDPIDSCNGNFAPLASYENDILTQLCTENWIYVDNESDIEAFVFENGHPGRFYLRKVSWLFPFLSHSNKMNLHPLHGITQAFRNEIWPKHWLNQRLDLWKNIALNETLEYLTVSLAKHNLPFRPGPKTNTVLSQVLEVFSVSQCYNFIWRAVRDAAAYYVRESISKKQAANSVVGNIQRAAERAQTQEWDINGYERIFECPQTILSDVTFNLAFNIGEKGFKLPPKDEYLPHHS